MLDREKTMKAMRDLQIEVEEFCRGSEVVDSQGRPIKKGTLETSSTLVCQDKKEKQWVEARLCPALSGKGTCPRGHIQNALAVYTSRHQL